MKTSAAGLSLIEAFEGFRASAYLDTAGYPTIGYGHKIRAGEVFAQAITEAQAQEILAHDLSIAERVVNTFALAHNIAFTQNEFDALASLVFNVGGAAFQNRDATPTHLAKALAMQDWPSAADAFLLFNHAGGHVSNGLTARRTKERALFLAPNTAQTIQ